MCNIFYRVQQKGLGEKGGFGERTDSGMTFIWAADQDGRNVKLELLYDP